MYYEFDGSQRCNMIIIITMSLLIYLAGTIKWQPYDDIMRLDTCTIRGFVGNLSVQTKMNDMMIQTLWFNVKQSNKQLL